MGQTPSAVDVSAGAGASGHQRGHEHVARAAGVLAHEDVSTGSRQPGGDGSAEGVGERRLEVLVGDAADAVGAEEVAQDAADTVTRTVSGVMRTASRPRGVRTMGMTSLSPTSRPATGISALISATDTSSSWATGPEMTTLTEGSSRR